MATVTVQGNSFTVPASSTQTILQQAAASLSSNQVSTVSSASFSVPLSEPYWHWNTRALYDSARKRVHFLFKIFQSGASSNRWRHYFYDESTNTTQSRDLSFITSNGHIYGNADIDPDTGDIYLFGNFGNNFYKYTATADSWTTESSNGFFTGSVFQKNGACFFPDFFGPGDDACLIASSNSVSALRVSNNQVTQNVASGLSMGTDSGDGHYDPDTQSALLGYTSNVRVTGPSSFTAESAPINTAGRDTSGSPYGSIHRHPYTASKLLLLQHVGGSNFYESTDGGQSWSGSLGTHPLADNYFTHKVSIDQSLGYGCIVAGDDNGGGRLRVWRPPA